MYFYKFAFLLISSILIYTSVHALSDAHQYLTYRIPIGDKRYQSFLEALTLMDKKEAKILVETGTARNGDENFIGDGGSTVLFAEWASKHQALFFSVDIDPMAVKISKKAIGSYRKHVRVICSDSISFLENFNFPIDFLYLDSYDYDEHNPEPSQNHHLKEIIAAYPKLHKNSIVLIDDCDLPNGGKGLLVKSFLLGKGWKIIYEGYQILFAKN